MLKTISKIGNSQGLILDAALCELTGLKAGDQVNVTVHDGGALTLTPMRPRIAASDAAASAKKLIRRNRELFKRLA
ncbi:MAG: AbrB family transcriptional regulator [Betaproteobacteria bacterium]|nr:AbrB family transcriptional regulator [Betaproteobacteria bacterium]